MTIGLNILTNSRLDAFQRCRRMHHFAYDLGVRPEPTEALRIGSAVHAAVEAFQRDGFPAAMDILNANYKGLIDATPDPDRAYWMHIEWIKCTELFIGWMKRWQGCGIQSVHSEMSFEVGIRNPDTGYPTQNYSLCGKIDEIVRLEDGRVAIREMKTTSDSLDPSSDYWRNLRMDQQISRYVVAARRIGFNVETVLYDVIRKPEISPSQVPLLDDDGIKVVLDANGDRVFNKNGTPRQSGSTADGWKLQTRIETTDEYRQRLHEDIAIRPAFYFARMEVPRLEADLAECEQELWDLQKTIAEAARTGRHYRNTKSCLHPRCGYFDVCANGIDLSSEAPEGFVRLDNIHPELEGMPIHDHNHDTATQTAAAGSEDAAAAYERTGTVTVGDDAAAVLCVQA